MATINFQSATYLLNSPSPDELNAVLGYRWAIARKTPSNLQRYAKCITRKEYEAAQKEALRRRSPGMWVLIRAAIEREIAAAQKAAA